MINAIIIADSISPQNVRITSFVLTVPQIIVKELLRHRMFSFSSSSIRAIPFNKILSDTKENMFIPLAFQKHHSGMQGMEYLTDKEAQKAQQQWVESGLKACAEAERLYNLGITKQLCSRIIEPYGYAKILVTATEWENFFDLRCPEYHYKGKVFKSRKDLLNANLGTFPTTLNDLEWIISSKSQAEIHIQALAESMWDVMNESKPEQLESGQWHIPFGDKVTDEGIWNFIKHEDEIESVKCKIATARCARLSYMTFEGEINYDKDIELYNRLYESRHASPFEHVCQALSIEEYEKLGKYVLLPNGEIEFQKGWVDNFRGYKSLRRILGI